MPFTMLYPPNMAALPPIAYPYVDPHPHPRREPSSLQRDSSAFSTIPSTPRSRTRSKQSHSAREKKERTPISAYIFAGLAGCAQYGVGFAAPGHMGDLTPTRPHNPSRVEQRQQRQAAPNPSTARFTEHIEEPEKVRGKKRRKVKNCGRMMGSWIAGLCWRDNSREGHSRSRLDEARLDEKHASATIMTERRVSSASEVTLVETVGHPGKEIPVHTHTHVFPATIYTGH